jgi:hypothetical protein
VSLEPVDIIRDPDELDVDEPVVIESIPLLEEPDLVLMCTSPP